MSALQLDHRGRCPMCQVKPLKYVREPHYFCHRCDRAFDLDAGIMIENWAWTKDNARKVRAT